MDLQKHMPYQFLLYILSNLSQPFQAAEHLHDKENITDLLDPALNFFEMKEKKELDTICKVIQDCIQPVPEQRPAMKEVTSKLREVIKISPDTAAPSLSTLWWTALELHRAESAEFV